MVNAGATRGVKGNTMISCTLFPGRYMQGAGALSRLRHELARMGRRHFLICSPTPLEQVLPPLLPGLKTIGDIRTERFGRECSDQEIQRLTALARDFGAEAVSAVGGGKTLDAAKMVAAGLDLPVALVPTIASTDAPCSSVSIIYSPQGEFERVETLSRNPDLVLVDTELIAKAPARYLVAGMGDALATYFEARACIAADKTNMPGGHATKAALALAKLCYDTLLADGVKALLAVEASACTKAVENIVEANTYLSGLGFESGGLGAAHAVHNGFTVMEECHGLYHGEKVAFGTLVQLVLENAPEKELEEVLGFCASVGLPVTLEEMGVTEVNPERIMEVAKTACAPGETIHNMPFAVTPQDVSAAILVADALGRSFLA